MSPCEISPYRVHKGGYVYVSREGKLWLHHRWVFFKATGLLPEAVMHLCDNPRCINLEHLAAGTRAENNRDRARKGRSAKSVPSRQRLNEEDVAYIRANYRKGKGGRGGPQPGSLKTLAAQFGVCHRVIYNVVKGTYPWPS